MLAKEYEDIIADVLDTIAEMRESGDYDENTLETLEWKLSPPKRFEDLRSAITPIAEFANYAFDQDTGEIIIYTGLKEDDFGAGLVPVEDEEI